MPKDVTIIDEVEDMASSTVSPDDAASSAAVETEGHEQQADASSASQPDDKEVDTLSLVRDVGVKKTGKTDAASSAEGEPGSKEQSSAEKERDEENFTDVPFNSHPRFQELLRRTKTAEVDAGRYRNVQSFLDDNDMKAEEAVDALQIVALAKRDAPAAWVAMAPFVKAVAMAAGEILPDNLQAQIDSGVLNRDQAFAVSRAEAVARAATIRSQFTDRRTQGREQQQAHTDLNTAVAGWQQERQKRDPNFAAKLPQIEKEILYLQSRDGVPKNIAAVKEQLDKAYKQANTMFRAATPAPKPTVAPVIRNGVTPAPVAGQRREIRPITGGQARANGVQSGDASTLDIVRANRRGASR